MTPAVERLYRYLPAVLQNIACSVEGWRTHRVRYGSAYDSIFGTVMARGNWTQRQIVEWRNQRLKAYLQSLRNSAYYGRFLGALDGNASVEAALDTLRSLPIISKKDVRQRLGYLRPDAQRQARGIPIHSSGTTGAGMVFCSSRSGIQEQWATWWRYRSWHGLLRGTWCAYLGGRVVVPHSNHSEPYWRLNHPGRQVLFSGYHLNENSAIAYLTEIRRRSLPWIHGYPSLISFLARIALAKGFDIGSSLRWITTGAENLLAGQRVAIEQAFGVRPRQHYGLAEAVANFSECEMGTLHVDEDFAFVEFVPSHLQGVYRVVGTNLSNSITPFIRYDTGDLVELGSNCNCGRPGRTVSRIDGRQEDYIILTSGARLGRLDHIFKDQIRVKEAQVYQPAIGRLVFRIVKDSGFSQADMTSLQTAIAAHIADKSSITLEFVDRLPRTSSGKLRFVISDVTEAKLSGDGQ